MSLLFPAPEYAHFSNIKNFALSPAHYIASLTPKKSTRSMAIGTLAHSIALGGDFVVWPGTRRDKGYKAFAESYDGETIVTESEHIQATRIVTSIRTNQDACEALEGDREKEFSWYVLGGRKAAGRPDVVNLDASHLTDLKTTKFSKPEWFSNEALRRRYHAQLAWYIDGVLDATGKEIKTAKLVAVESAAPFAVTVFQVTPRALDDGRKQIRLWLERLQQCEIANTWPAYVQSVVELDTPEEFAIDFDDGGDRDADSKEDAA
jgi:hypothetical protein